MQVLPKLQTYQASPEIVVEEHKRMYIRSSSRNGGQRSQSRILQCGIVISHAVMANCRYCTWYIQVDKGTKTSSQVGLLLRANRYNHQSTRKQSKA